MRVFLSPPDIRGPEVEFVVEALESGWIAPIGPALERFESDVAAVAGREFAVGLVNATAGLQLALEVLGVGPGDQVASSTLTFVASANAIAHVGATPVFIDSDSTTWNMDPELLEELLADRAAAGKQIAAVVTVDIYGQCADYGRISEICSRYGVPLVEDAAEAVGATCNGKPAGSFGEMAVFSFNGNKIITTSGGGMFLTDSAEIAERARFLATQANLPALHYQHEERGHNWRLSNILAALGSAQLLSLDDRVARRREINQIYRRAFADTDFISFMPEADYGNCTFWLTCMVFDPALAPMPAHEVVAKLQAEEIETRPAWKPMHLQPAYANEEFVGGGVSDHVFNNGICLPSGSGLPDHDIELVIDTLRQTLGLS